MIFKQGKPILITGFFSVGDKVTLSVFDMKIKTWVLTSLNCEQIKDTNEFACIVSDVLGDLPIGDYCYVMTNGKKLIEEEFTVTDV